MKIGDIVKLKANPDTEWMSTYTDYFFEVEAVFERNCRVRMLECINPERYWLVQKEVFEIVEK